LIHQIIYIYPRPDLTDEAAQRYWLDKHSPLFRSGLPQIRAYLVASVLPDLGQASPALGMGSAEVWLDDGEQMLSLLQSSLFKAGRVDEPNFAAFWRTLFLITEDYPLVEGPGPVVPEPAVKLQLAVKRREGLPRGTFRQRCLDGVGTGVTKVPGLLRHVQCHTADMAYAIGETPLDAVFHLWFPSPDAAAKATASEEYALALRELQTISEPRYVHTLLTRERWLVAPGQNH
jgi:uncharacterized protein (TIGR02118 family)